MSQDTDRAASPLGECGTKDLPESPGDAQVWGTGKSPALTELGGSVLLGIGVTPHLCDPRRQRAPCQHCHPVLEGCWGSLNYFKLQPKNTSLQ